MTGAALRDTKTASAWPLRLAALLPYLFLLGAAYSVFAETVDDPYITFRYAANLLAGHGPVFNVGERVEGFTSPLHLLLSIILLTVAPAVDILFKAKCASLFFAFVMLAQTNALARRSGLGRWGAVLAQALVALNINFALAAVNALETTLYGVLLLAGLLLFHQECRSGRGLLSGALLFLATLARPEAFLVVAALLVVRLLRGRAGRLPFGFAAGWLAAFLVPAALFEIARWGYYGQLLPNTYFAKAQPLMQSLSGGIAYPLRAMSPTPTVPADLFRHLSRLNGNNLLAFGSLTQKNIRSDLFNLVLPLLFWGLALLGLVKMGRRTLGVISLAVVAAVLVFVLKAGGDWMYGWRFMAPILPLLAVSQCHGIRALARRRVRPLPPGRARAFPARNAARIGGAFVAVLWLVSCTKTNHYSWRSTDFSTHGSRLLQVSEGYGPLWVKGADYIRQLPRGTTVAYSEMGYAGYSNMDKPMLDIRGLTDREIAHLPARYKYSTGVADQEWYRQGDPLGRILRGRRPQVIISFDDVPPRAALSGYRRCPTLLMPTSSAAAPIPAYVFRRRG